MEAILGSLQEIPCLLQYRQPEKSFYRQLVRYSSRFPYTSEDDGFKEATKYEILFRQHGSPESLDTDIHRLSSLSVSKYHSNVMAEG